MCSFSFPSTQGLFTYIFAGNCTQRKQSGANTVADYTSHAVPPKGELMQLENIALNPLIPMLCVLRLNLAERRAHQ
jgi:hypothetical protein